MSDLIKGQTYRIKDEVELKVSRNPVKFVISEDYWGKTYHRFYDSKTGLYHWLHPDEVEPVEARKGNE